MLYIETVTTDVLRAYVCTYVCSYVCTYVSVTLRNVNLRSRSYVDDFMRHVH